MTKEIKRGKYTLRHTVLDSDFGPENFFELTFVRTEGKDKGMLIKVPFHEPFKARTHDQIYPNVPQTYTPEEYEKMLTDAIASFERYHHE